MEKENIRDESVEDSNDKNLYVVESPKYKSLYIRVSERVYKKVQDNAKKMGMTIQKYIIHCTSLPPNVEGAWENPKPKTRILYVRTTENKYNEIVKRASEMHMTTNEYIIFCATGEYNIVEPKEPKTKAIYIRVTEEVYNKVLINATVLNMNLGQYIDYCTTEESKGVIEE